MSFAPETHCDEYLEILNGFTIQARIENQNITYFYPGRENGKRGKNLSPELDKPGLEKKFAESREKIEKDSKLKETLKVLKPNQIAKLPNIDASYTQYSEPNLITKREGRFTNPRAEVLEQSQIPIDEIRNAKAQSILKYCEKESIGVIHFRDGKNVLRNREYVEVQDCIWINHKNKTQGTIIDFVANHQSVSLLHAVSIIN